MKWDFLKLVEKYYRVQEFVNIGWAEFSWFNDSLIEMMAIIFLLESSFGIKVQGKLIPIALISAFVLFYNFGKYLKRKHIYDMSEYVRAKIDPVQDKILRAAEIILKEHSEKLKKDAEESLSESLNIEIKNNV